MIKIFEGVMPLLEDHTEYTVEDSGAAIILDHFQEQGNHDPDNGMFVLVQSWDDRDVPAAEHHIDIKKLFGKRVRVTVEVLD